jgi:hypothetical protein
MTLISQKLSELEYFVGETQMRGLENFLKEQIVIEGSKGKRVETISLPKITKPMCDN